jgi:hypothetical protein
MSCRYEEHINILIFNAPIRTRKKYLWHAIRRHIISCLRLPKNSNTNTNNSTIFKFNYLFIYVLIQQPKGQLQRKHEQNRHIKKDKKDNVCYLHNNHSFGSIMVGGEDINMGT